MIPAGDEGEKRHSGTDWLTGLGGGLVNSTLEVQSGINGSPFQAWTYDNSGRGDLMVTRAGDEGLRRGSAARANELYNAGGGERTGST